MPYPSFELSSGSSRAKTWRRTCAKTPAAWLASQHPPEDDERSGDQREFRRSEQQQARDLLVLDGAIRLIEEMVRERQRDPRDGWRHTGHHQVADLGDRRQPSRAHNRPPEQK